MSKHHPAVRCRSGRLAVLAALVFVAVPVAAAAATVAPPPDTTRTVTLTEPAVAYVATSFTVKVRVTYPDPEELSGKDIAEFTYSAPYASGSAVGVADGTFVTAAHVTGVPAEAARNYAANKVFFGELDLGYSLESGESPFERYTISDDEVLDGWLQQCYRAVGDVCGFDQSVAVTVQLPGQAAGNASKPVRAAVLGDPQRAAESDVAVLRVGSGAVHNPTAALAASSAGLQSGQDVAALGFPGQAASLPAATTQPTKLFGHISNVRDLDAGQVVEVDIRLQKGMSGGPAVDDHGAVVGLISFTTVDAEGDRGQGYLRTVEDIRSALRDVGVEATRGAVDTAFAEAMKLYWDAHFSAAVPLFQKVLGLYARHALAAKYLAVARSKASGPEDVPLPTPTVARAPVRDEGSPLPLIGRTAGAVVVVVLIGWGLSRLRRKPAAPAGPAGGDNPGRGRSYDDTTTPTDSWPWTPAGAASEADPAIHQPTTRLRYAPPASRGLREAPGAVAAPAADRRFCHGCGAPVRPDGHFCPQCGQQQ